MRSRRCYSARVLSPLLEQNLKRLLAEKYGMAESDLEHEIDRNLDYHENLDNILGIHGLSDVVARYDVERELEFIERRLERNFEAESRKMMPQHKHAKPLQPSDGCPNAGISGGLGCWSGRGAGIMLNYVASNKDLAPKPTCQSDSTICRASVASRLVESVDETLEMLGLDAKNHIYSYLEKRFDLKTDEIPNGAREFSLGLLHLFGSTSKSLEREIVERLCEKLEVDYVSDENFDFVSHIESLY